MLGYLGVIKCKVSCSEQKSLHGLSQPVQNCLLFRHLIKLTCLSPYPPVCSQWHDDVYFSCIFVKIMWACRSHTMWLEFSDNKTVKFYHKSSIMFCWVTIWQMIHKLIAQKFIIFQSAGKSKWIQFKFRVIKSKFRVIKITEVLHADQKSSWLVRAVWSRLRRIYTPYTHRAWATLHICAPVVVALEWKQSEWPN